jgi:hypothetical protein
VALIPKDRYPGQITTTDPAYPHGKAQNISAPRDGTGTPFEADLVNDSLGFQQSLLAEAAVVPSGVPDKVGASQYLTSIYKMIRDKAHTFTKSLTFMSSAQFRGGVQFWEDLTLYDHTYTNEVKYYPSRTRTMLIPMFRVQRVGTDFEDFTINRPGLSVGGSRLINGGTNTHPVVPLELPTGSTLTRVRACMSAGGGGTSTLGIRLFSQTPTLVASSQLSPVLETKLDESPAMHEVVDADDVHILEIDMLAVIVDRAATLLMIEFSLPRVGDAIHWIEVQFSDPGPRNH